MYRYDDEYEQDMSGNQPGKHEEAKHDVATQAAPHVFDHLGQLHHGTCISKGKEDYSGKGAYMHQKRTGSRTSHTSMRTMMRHPTLVKFQA